MLEDTDVSSMLLQLFMSPSIPNFVAVLFLLVAVLLGSFEGGYAHASCDEMSRGYATPLGGM